MSPGFPPAVIAAARDAAKAHLRMAGTSEDEGVAGAAASALALAEAFTARAWIERGWTGVLGGGAGWQRLETAPVRAILGVEALAADGSASALPVGGYAVDIDGDGEGWVRVSAPAGRVRVTYRAGAAADWDTLPAPVAQGVVLLAAHLLGGRAGAEPPPAAVSALWRPWRRMRLAGAEARA
jgi:uncharacterized phiE125 gp8 family phage protein